MSPPFADSLDPDGDRPAWVQYPRLNQLTQIQTRIARAGCAVMGAAQLGVDAIREDGKGLQYERKRILSARRRRTICGAV